MQTCPVCGYDGLKRGPVEGVICPSCGVQFGYSDAGPLPSWKKHKQLRQKWIARGARWYSNVTSRPQDWNPWDQLIKAQFGDDIPFSKFLSVIDAPRRMANSVSMRLPHQSDVTVCLR